MTCLSATEFTISARNMQIARTVITPQATPAIAYELTLVVLGISEYEQYAYIVSRIKADRVRRSRREQTADMLMEMSRAPTVNTMALYLNCIISQLPDVCNFDKGGELLLYRINQYRKKQTQPVSYNDRSISRLQIQNLDYPRNTIPPKQEPRWISTHPLRTWRPPGSRITQVSPPLALSDQYLFIIQLLHLGTRC